MMPEHTRNPFGSPKGCEVAETRLGFAPYHYEVKPDGSVFAWRGQMSEREYTTFRGTDAKFRAIAWCKGEIE